MAKAERLLHAARAVASADALVIGAGAGMGVDSGLPDFRGTQGFWRAYPAYEKLGLDFSAMANPRWFTDEPTLAWGFYGHRLNLYRATPPHAGFALLRAWGQRMSQGAFIFTSNVDGHFQRAGFDPECIVEVHGSFAGMQCLRACGVGIFPGDQVQVAIDGTTLRAAEPLPRCPACGGMARPNILMFGDWDWDGACTEAQRLRLETWARNLANARVVVIECGAGTAIPTVRHFCEKIAAAARGTLIRLNPREPDVPAGQIGLDLGALEGLRAIDELLPR